LLDVCARNDSVQMNHFESHEEFQEELFQFIERQLAVDALRFNVYMPRIDLNVEITSGDKIYAMTQDYQKKFWLFDPLHPSRYDNLDTIVISNSMLMTDSAWMNTRLYKEFFEPNGIFHNVDMFFRRNERIIAVLSLLRNDKDQPFTQRELGRLQAIQPFVQFTLNKIYLPRRIHDRTTLGEEFELTPRELDVVELALTGASNKILVDQLKISLPTLRTHLQNIYTKVGVHSNSELISKLLGILK